jgi:hypothetical protein
MARTRAAAAPAPRTFLTIISCEANAPDTVVVTFSEEIDINTPLPGDPRSYGIDLFGGPGAPITVNPSLTSVQLAFNNTIAIITLQAANPITLIVGQQIRVTVNPNIIAKSQNVFAPNTNFAVTQVLGVGNALGNIATNTANIATNTGSTSGSLEDLAAFSLLTEEVGYPPSPLARSSSGAGTMVPAAGGSLGQIAAKAVSDVLGWQAKPDPKGFLGALNASFKLEEVEGHTQAVWTPRTYAIQTDLSGGITGAQASVYKRAKDALDQSLPLLDGLYPLFKEAKDEDVAALRAIVRSQFTDLVGELGLIGGPRIARVTQLFSLLLGQPNFPQNSSQVPGFPLKTDPDKISGSLGNLRVEFGFSIADDQVNTVEDEQDVTNFRIVTDYITSLAQSWLNNLGFFGLQTQTPFFGTQLVLLSRQLSVIAESANEVRFTLDSVFIGPAERQTLQINFSPPAPANTPSMFLEDLLTWIDSFASEEGPRLIQDGGKFAVSASFVPIGTQLQALVAGAVPPNGPANLAGLPRGYKSKRVQSSLEELRDQLQELVNLAAPISHVITPEPEPQLAVLGINPNVLFQSAIGTTPTTLSVTIIGTGFDGAILTPTTISGPGVTISAPPLNLTPVVPPLSENLILAQLALAPIPLVGNYVVTITVTNRDLKSATLQTSFTVLP